MRLKRLYGQGIRLKQFGEFTNPLEALERVDALKADAAFLDIEMPGMDGLELAGRLMDRQRRLEVVFVTAYNEYAVEAFELHALDYLLKPVMKERLQKTMRRLLDREDVRPPQPRFETVGEVLRQIPGRKRGRHAGQVAHQQDGGTVRLPVGQERERSGPGCDRGPLVGPYGQEAGAHQLQHLPVQPAENAGRIGIPEHR